MEEVVLSGTTGMNLIMGFLKVCDFQQCSFLKGIKIIGNREMCVRVPLDIHSFIIHNIAN